MPVQSLLTPDDFPTSPLFLQDHLDSLLDQIAARPDIDWGAADYEDLAVSAEILDSLPSPSFELQAVSIRFRTAGLKLSQISVADTSDLPPESSSSAVSLPNPSVRDTTVATNIPSVCPPFLFFSSFANMFIPLLFVVHPMS